MGRESSSLVVLGLGCFSFDSGLEEFISRWLEDGFGAVEDGFGEAGEAGDLDAVGFVGGAGEDFVEEDDFLVPLADGDVEVGDGFAGVGEVGELVVVGGEEGAALDLVVEVLGDGPGDGEAVEGGGAAADFVEDDEGFLGGVVEDEGGFGHLDHEGGLAAWRGRRWRRRGRRCGRRGRWWRNRRGRRRRSGP